MAKNQPAAGNVTTAEDLKALTRQHSKKVESRVWGGSENPLNEGDILVGRLIAVDHNVGEHGSTMLRFEDPKGSEVATWQRGTLKTKVNESMTGKYLMIEYLGVEPAKKKGFDDMHLFDVYKLTEQQFQAWSSVELPF